MPGDSMSADADALHEITAQCLHALDQVAVLRRLVVSMALNITVDFMPDDERTLLYEIMGES